MDMKGGKYAKLQSHGEGGVQGNILMLDPKQRLDSVSFNLSSLFILLVAELV